MAGFDDHDLAEGLDPDGPSAEDLDRFGGELVTCPHCGADASDQALACHVCGGVLGEKPAGAAAMPMWAWITLGVVILLVFAWVI